MVDELDGETVAGTSHGVGADETEIVVPLTAAAPELAWSAEDETIEIRRRSWRSPWGGAVIFVAWLSLSRDSFAEWPAVLPIDHQRS